MHLGVRVTNLIQGNQTRWHGFVGLWVRFMRRVGNTKSITQERKKEKKHNHFLPSSVLRELWRTTTWFFYGPTSPCWGRSPEEYPSPDPSGWTFLCCWTPGWPGSRSASEAEGASTEPSLPSCRGRDDGPSRTSACPSLALVSQPRQSLWSCWHSLLKV